MARAEKFKIRLDLCLKLMKSYDVMNNENANLFSMKPAHE